MRGPSVLSPRYLAPVHRPAGRGDPSTPTERPTALQLQGPRSCRPLLHTPGTGSKNVAEGEVCAGAGPCPPGPEVGPGEGWGGKHCCPGKVPCSPFPWERLSWLEGPRQQAWLQEEPGSRTGLCILPPNQCVPSLPSSQGSSRGTHVHRSLTLPRVSADFPPNIPQACAALPPITPPLPASSLNPAP